MKKAIKKLMVFKLIIDDVKQIEKITSSKDYKNGKADSFKRLLNIQFKSYFYDIRYMKYLDINYFTDEMVRKDFSCEQLGSYFSSFNLFDQLHKITCPTLIVHGEYDPIPFQSLEQIHKVIKGSQFFLLKECGHFAHIEKADEYFKIIIDFLDKNFN